MIGSPLPAGETMDEFARLVREAYPEERNYPGFSAVSLVENENETVKMPSEFGSLIFRELGCDILPDVNQENFDESEFSIGHPAERVTRSILTREENREIVLPDTIGTYEPEFSILPTVVTPDEIFDLINENFDINDDDFQEDDFDDDFDEDYEELPDDEYEDFPDPYSDEDYEEVDPDQALEEGDDAFEFDEFDADENTFVDDDEEDEEP